LAPSIASGGVGPRFAVPARVDEVSDPAWIARLGVLRLRGVAVDGRLEHPGGVPGARITAAWLAACADALRAPTESMQ
jgi:hypothetical protein